VPVAVLLDHLADGASVTDFLIGYPGVTRSQAEAVAALVAAGAL
jgi:uncharacterized protein (DUF433 family)